MLSIGYALLTVLGEEYEQAITNLMEMGGYDRDEVVRAMNASFNNPSRAAEYLMSVSVHNIHENLFCVLCFHEYLLLSYSRKHWPITKVYPPNSLNH